MAILGAAVITGVRPDPTAGLMIVLFEYAGFVSGNQVGATNSQVVDLDVNLPVADIGVAVEQAAQALLITGAGYTFGAGDYVRLIGGV